MHVLYDQKKWNLTELQVYIKINSTFLHSFYLKYASAGRMGTVLVNAWALYAWARLFCFGCMMYWGKRISCASKQCKQKFLKRIDFEIHKQFHTKFKLNKETLKI